ncbi:hypothetical protein [Curtobacterium flaccumfaciens]|uniref:hypothetical protein n=1 Tax=Curtobacterium flaccumfaciens TaxID=2035 RepID=UPI001E401432|nr:hypothetical protein [Curtobacterium allii]MCE0459493.1 hypothetical protein [Curtobacterium allii]
MKKRPELSDRPEVAQHLHDDIVVTREKLDAFMRDDDAVQLLVLAELRSRAADQETTLVLTLQAATVTILAVMLARIPVGSAAPSSSGWTGSVAFAIAALVLAAFAILLIMPSVRNAVIGNRNRQRAVVWLAAYEQALSESAPDRVAPAVRSELRRLVRALSRARSRRVSG